MTDSPPRGLPSLRLPSLPTVDVVLMPSPDIARRSEETSRQLAEHGTEFTLRDGELFAHLSLYMGTFDRPQWELEQVLADIAKETPPVRLTAERYTQDLDHGMIEITYENSAPVTRLQEMVVAAFNPLRSGMRERDPVGRVLREWQPTTTGEVRTNLERYGYDEIGGHFRPHITFTRFRLRDLSIDTGALPPPAAFSGIFPTLGLFEMGEHGTCTRRMVELRLGDNR